MDWQDLEKKAKDPSQWPKVGAKLYQPYGPRERMYHVIGTVQDGEDTVFVLKEWWKHRQKYSYITITAFMLVWNRQKGVYLTKAEQKARAEDES